MKLHFLGGAMEIGGSCIYLRIAGKGILMDAGIRQSGTKDPLPDFRTIQEQGGLDVILISHAHMDHIGTLPIVSKAYPNAQIYMTAMTADLTRVLLYDSLKIMNYRENEIPYYSERDVISMLDRIRVAGYQTSVHILDGFTMTLYPAGHIAGASCIYLATEEGTLFYSGDFSAFSQRTIEGLSIPKLRPDVAIVETTYGNRLHANRQVEEKRLVSLVKECVREKKKILIPVFALGRAQEVLLILRSAMQNKEIPAVPVYVDGMVRDINIMYTRNPVYLKNSLGKRIMKGNEPFYTDEIQPVTASQKREELLNQSGPAIFLASSGMLTGGPSALYARTLAASENACIIITGYQDEESPGRQLLDLLAKPEGAAGSGNPEGLTGMEGAAGPGNPEGSAGKEGAAGSGNPEGSAGKEGAVGSGNSEGSAGMERAAGSVNPEGAVSSENTEGIGGLGNQADFAKSDIADKHGDRSLNLNGIYVPVNCRIEQVGLSAHGDKTEIMALLERLSARRIFLVHGNQDAMEELGRELAAEDCRRQVFLPECGQSYDVMLHSRRKQLAFHLDHTMQMKREYTAGDEKLFWEYWQTHYSGMLFSIAQLAYIWYGRDVTDNDILQTMQSLLWNSCYFTPNTKRLFLLAADTPEAVAAALAPRELTQQELNAYIERYFADCPYRKISHHGGRKEVLLQFDYPDAQDKEEFGRKAADFNAATGWTIQISPSMNHNAAYLLLSVLFGDRLSKTSYYAEKKCYMIALDGGCEDEDRKAAERFCSDTGWQLFINGQQPSGMSSLPVSGSEKPFSEGDFFCPANDMAEKAEQNTAFALIDQVFEQLPHKPDKKSLKQDSDGKYLEISFVSPAIGRRYQTHLQNLSDQMGWRLRIADKVNQNELFKTAQLLCLKHGISLAKNPSYLPARKAIQLKTAEPQEQEKYKKAAEEFQEITGCDCIFIS